MTGVVNGTIAQLGVQDTTFLYMILRRRVGSAYATGGVIGADEDSDWASTESSKSSSANILPVSYNPSTSGAASYTSAPVPQASAASWSGWTSGYGFGGGAVRRQRGRRNVQLRWHDHGRGAHAGRQQLVRLLRRVYSHLGLSLVGLPQTASANQGLFGGYFLRDFTSAYVLAAASAGFSGYNETRHIAFGNVNATAQGQYSGWQPSGYFEYGRRYQWGRTMLQPYAALQYIYLRQNGFTETGAGVLNQSVGGVDTNATAQTVRRTGLADLADQRGPRVGARVAGRVDARVPPARHDPDGHLRANRRQQFRDAGLELRARLGRAGLRYPVCPEPKRQPVCELRLAVQHAASLARRLGRRAVRLVGACAFGALFVQFAGRRVLQFSAHLWPAGLSHFPRRLKSLY